MPKSTKHQPVTETFDDPDALKECVSQMLHGDDCYWHDRIRRILAAAGFNATRIQREPEHPVWLMWLTRTSFDLAADKLTAAKQIRKLLVRAELKSFAMNSV